MKKKFEDIEMVVDGTPLEEAQAVATELVQPAFTAKKTIQNGLITYEVDAPVNGKAKLTVTNRLEGTKVTIKLIELSEAEFADEALLKAKLVK